MLKKELMVKDEGGKEIIVEVGLAVVGVALLLIFRRTITELVTELVNAARENIRLLFAESTNSLS